MAALPDNATRPAPVDLGPASSVEGNAPASVTVVLKLRNADEMQARMEAIYSDGNPEFHRFLSIEQFSAQFGPAPETIAQVARHFEDAGFSVARMSVAHLSVTGSIAAMEAEFGVTLHTFEVPATTSAAPHRYRSPVGILQLPNDIAAAVDGVVGLDTRPRYRSQLLQSTRMHALAPPASLTSSVSGLKNAPGALTVLDFANYYGVEPLYHHGLDGRGTTIGIVTLASFTPSDAFGYWNSLDLEVSPNRITEIEIDGGSGPPSDASGSVETTIDVEQAGGLAPAAKIHVYEAPNTNQGFVDAFAAVIETNRADTISCSWGDWEYYFYLDAPGPRGGAAIDPRTGNPSTQSIILKNLFAQAALQGQSI
jgi:subtilase family serine protease